MKKTSFLGHSLAGLLILLAGPASTRAAEDETGFKHLFNGRSLNGWSGQTNFWSVKDGAIVGRTTEQNTTKENTFLLYTNATVDNFEPRFSYKITGGNSGVQYRSEHYDNFVVGGYQADIDSGDRFSGILYEERGRGILSGRGDMTHVTTDGKRRMLGSLGKADEIQKVIKTNDWNDYVIVANGNRLMHSINGRVTTICIDDQTGTSTASGILALQLHAGPPMTVQFRNIRMRPLEPTTK